MSFGSTSVPLAAGDVIDDTTIAVSAPPAAQAGPVEVTVSTPNGTSTRNPGDVFTYVAAPLLTDIAGSVGVADPSAFQVDLEGFGLWGTSSVSFGTTSVSGSAISQSDDQDLEITPPALGLGTVPVSLTATATTIVPVPVTYDEVPQVDNVELIPPATGNITYTTFAPEGPLAGGQTFQISGSGFTDATKVLFGTIPASSFTVTSDDSITGTVPTTSTPGPVDVTVTGPYGTSAVNANDVWFYDPGGTIGVGTRGSGTPAISEVDGQTIGLDYVPFGTESVDGPSGAAPGSTVTLTGTNFSGTTAVDFGSTSAASFTVDSDTQLSVTVPSSLTATAAITVTNADGTSLLTPAVSFTPTTKPIVTLVTTSGDSATIEGSGFTGATAVNFGGVPATSYSVENDGTITAQLPTAVTKGDVTVTTPAGTSPVNPDDVFGYYSPTTPLLNNYYLYSGVFWEYGQLSSFGVTPGSFGLGVGVPSGGDAFGTASGFSSSIGGPVCAEGPTPTSVLFGPAFANGLGTSSSSCIPPVSGYNVTATTPPDPNPAPGPVSVRVSNGTATSPILPGAFWYYGPSGTDQVPVITGIGATQVMLSDASYAGYAPTVPVFGSGFSNPIAVTIGGVSVPLSDVQIVNDDLMLLTLPANTPTSATTPDVLSVTTSVGTSASNSDDLVTVTQGTSATAPPAPPTAINTASGVSNTTTGTATASVGSVSASATGEGGVTVSTYATDPESSAPVGSTGTYMDVSVSSNDSFTSLDLTVCGLTPGESLDYYDGSSWIEMSPQTFDASTDCATATLNNTSSTPLISDLTGTPIAVVTAGSTGGAGGTGGTVGGGGGTPTATPPPITFPQSPPRPTPLPIVGLSTSLPPVWRSKVRLELSCDTPTACKGTVRLAHGSQILGSGNYTLAAGSRSALVINLDTAGAHLIELARNGHLGVIAEVTVNGGASVTRSIVLVGQAHAIVTSPARQLAVRGGEVAVTLHCSKVACRGALRLSRGSAVLAERSYAIAVGKEATLKLHLSHMALLELAQARGHTLLAAETISARGAPTARTVVRLVS